MDSITLDFSDASFDVNEENTFIIENDDMIYMSDDGAVPADSSPSPNVSVSYDRDDDNNSTVIGSAAITVPQSFGEIFEFEFDDGEDGGAGEYTMRVETGTSGVLAIKASEDLMPKVMDGDLFEITTTVDFNDGEDLGGEDLGGEDLGGEDLGGEDLGDGGGGAFTPLPVMAGGIGLGTLGHNGMNWVADVGLGTQIAPSWSDAEGYILFAAANAGASAQSVTIGSVPLGLFDPMAALMPDQGDGLGENAIYGHTDGDLDDGPITETLWLGDGGGDAGEDYRIMVASGDMNGRAGTASNDTIIFQPSGDYGGVFRGGDGFDTLVFDFETPDDADGVTVDLMSGTVTFQDSQGSHSSVTVGETVGGSFEFDYERIELNGNDDLIIVGEGVGAESDDMALSNGRGNEPVISGLFQVALGAGDDDMYVDDISSGIMLDLGYTHERADGNINYNDVTISDDDYGNTTVGVETVYHDGSPNEYDTILGATGDGTSAVIDYIDYTGADSAAGNYVYNESSQGVVVKFGNHTGSNYDMFDADGSSSESNVIDLRYEDNITVSWQDASFDSELGHDVDISSADANGDGVYINAIDVDYMLVGDASDTDVLASSAHLYGDYAGILNQAVTDAHQGGYDVLTSGYLSGFGDIAYNDGSSNNDLQIKYSGDADDFIDGRDAITRDASVMSVSAESVDHVMSTQHTWEAQVADNGGSGVFYVEVEGKKVNVYFDELDGAWKVDSTAFGVANNVAVNAGVDYSDIEARIEAASGTVVDLASLSDQDIFLNATETDIISLLEGNDLYDVENGAAHNFSFYTTVGGVNVAVDFDGMGWELSNSEVLVQTADNTMSADGEIGVGSIGVDFIEMGSGIAMGNAGSDTYTVGDGTSGIINELGHVTIDDDLNLQEITEAGDTVRFESVESLGDLSFSRTKILGEKAGNTLEISDGTNSSVQLFDQYNDFLEFRRTEFLVIDDGATADEIFELHTSADANISSWDNEIYVASDSGGELTVDVGGEDHVFLGSGQDTVKVNVMDAMMASYGNFSVTVNDIGSNDIFDAGEDMGGGLKVIRDGDLGGQWSDYFNNHEDRDSITKVEISNDDENGLSIRAYDVNGNELLDDDGGSFYSDPFFGMA